MARTLLALLLFAAGLLSPADAAFAARQSPTESRRTAGVRFQTQPVYPPGADVSFNFALPAGKVTFTLMKADLGELTQQLLAQSAGTVDLSNAAVVRTWVETADPKNPGAFNRPVTFKSPEPGVYVLEARWGDAANQVQYHSFVSTETALLVKRSLSSAAVWVVNRRTGQPVPEALVHARFASAPTAEARTNRDGLATLRLDRPEQQGMLCVVSALAGKQWAAAAAASYGAPAPPAPERTFLWMNA